MKKTKIHKHSEEYANFEKLAKQLISVPKSEIDKREAEYQRQKKSAKKRKEKSRPSHSGSRGLFAMY
jgi:hypothetical protein